MQIPRRRDKSPNTSRAGTHTHDVGQTSRRMGTFYDNGVESFPRMLDRLLRENRNVETRVSGLPRDLGILHGLERQSSKEEFMKFMDS
jgi:hypothetical protein